jgi:hypothetical protein
MTNLSARFDQALTYAHQLHSDQFRKGTQIPYLAHLLSVAGLVLDYGGDEDQAIASLLHDALEDQGDRTSVPKSVSGLGNALPKLCSPAPIPQCSRNRGGVSARQPTSRI